MLKYLLLGLLAERPRHGYDLKRAFEGLLGGTWMLNIGQIYTTLAALEEDGLVRWEPVQQELLPDRKVYSITDVGHKELRRWVVEPAGGIKLRDEFYFKLLIQFVSGDDVEGFIWSQRDERMQVLQELARMKDEAADSPLTGLLLDGVALRIQADLKWLDEAEARLEELTT